MVNSFKMPGTSPPSISGLRDFSVEDSMNAKGSLKILGALFGEGDFRGFLASIPVNNKSSTYLNSSEPWEGARNISTMDKTHLFSRSHWQGAILFKHSSRMGCG